MIPRPSINTSHPVICDQEPNLAPQIKAGLKSDPLRFRLLRVSSQSQSRTNVTGSRVKTLNSAFIG